MALLLSDPLLDLQRELSSKTSMPGLLVTVLAFLVVVGVAHGFTSATRYAVREKKRNILILLIGLFAWATYVWWNRAFAILIFVALALVVLRKPLRRLLRRKKKREADS